jgi:hypothetical protein
MSATANKPTIGRLKALGFDSYDEYLCSPHWRGIRTQYRSAEDRPQNCINCGADRFELHHKTYERLGAEELDDLIPLCRDCHQLVHVLERRGDSDLAMSGLTSAERAAAYAVETREREAQAAEDFRVTRDQRKILRGFARELKAMDHMNIPDDKMREGLAVIRACVERMKQPASDGA